MKNHKTVIEYMYNAKMSPCRLCIFLSKILPYIKKSPKNA